MQKFLFVFLFIVNSLLAAHELGEKNSKKTLVPLVIKDFQKGKLVLCLDAKAVGCAPSIIISGKSYRVDGISIPEKIKRLAKENYETTKTLEYSLKDFSAVLVKEKGHMPNPMVEQEVLKIVKTYTKTSIHACNRRVPGCKEVIRFRSDIFKHTNINLDISRVDSEVVELLKNVNGYFFFNSIVKGYIAHSEDPIDDGKVFVALEINLDEKIKEKALEKINSREIRSSGKQPGGAEPSSTSSKAAKAQQE